MNMMLFEPDDDDDDDWFVMFTERAKRNIMKCARAYFFYHF